MNSRGIRAARRLAQRRMQYRRWAQEPLTAAIPSIDVLSDTRIHRLENERELRRAQNGVHETAPAGIEGPAPRISPHRLSLLAD